MADDNNPVVPAQDNAPKVDDQKPEKVYNGKYNSVADLEKAYAEAEQKLGQQGEDLKNLRQFQAEVYPLVDVVYSNDEIMKQIRQAADAKYNPPQTDNTEQKPQAPDPKVAQQENYLRQRAIDDFKVKNGLDQLSTEDYSQVEKQLMDTMSRWVIPGQPVPLDRVNNLLEDAYSLIKNKKLVDDKVMESLANVQTNQRATMSPVQSSTTNDSGAELTEDERRLAEKLGVKPEDAAAYKKRYAEGNEESIIKN